MYGRCETDPFDQATEVCDSCYGEFCDSCVVTTKTRRHPICKDCAIVESGVRPGARPLLRGSKKTAAQRRQALREAPRTPVPFEYFDAVDETADTEAIPEPEHDRDRADEADLVPAALAGAGAGAENGPADTDCEMVVEPRAEPANETIDGPDPDLAVDPDLDVDRQPAPSPSSDAPTGADSSADDTDDTDDDGHEDRNGDGDTAAADPFRTPRPFVGVASAAEFDEPPSPVSPPPALAGPVARRVTEEADEPFDPFKRPAALPRRRATDAPWPDDATTQPGSADAAEGTEGQRGQVQPRGEATPLPSRKRTGSAVATADRPPSGLPKRRSKRPPPD